MYQRGKDLIICTTVALLLSATVFITGCVDDTGEVDNLLIDDSPVSLETRASPNAIYIYDDGTHGDTTAGDDMYTNDPFDITVHVKDNNGDKVPGAIVGLEGMGVVTEGGERVKGETDGNGQVVFRSLKITDQRNDGKITITVERGDLNTSINIPVVRK